MKKRLIYALSAVLLLSGPLAVVSCGTPDTPVDPDPHHGEDPDPEQPVEVTGISIDAPSVTTLNKGETVQLHASLTPSNATATISWLSSNNRAASVSTSGLVTAKEVSEDTTVTITASASGKTATVSLVIKKTEGGGDTPVVPPVPEDDDEVARFEVRKANEGSLYEHETLALIMTAYNSKGEVIAADFDCMVDDETILKETSAGSGVFVAQAKAGTATISVLCLDNIDLPEQEVTVEVKGAAETANGAFNYVANSYEQNLEILGKLEEYAVNNHLTGITLFQNGGYVMYSSRIRKGTNNYITGYGFGILSEGSIEGELEAEPKQEWKRYLHSYGGNSNKEKYNYLDDTGSESASLYSYVASTLYDTKMNATADGYDYYPLLAKPSPNATGKDKNRPIALNLSAATGLASKYRIYVRTGEDGLKYNYGSDRKYTFIDSEGNQKTNYSFKERPVDIEDYITPYKLLLNQKIKLNRSTDMISDTSDSTLKGAKAYYTATKNNSNINSKEVKQLFDKLVGLKSGKDANGYYLDFELNRPITPFSAMTNLSSTLTSPIPEDFIRAISPAWEDSSLKTQAAKEAEVYNLGMKKAYGINSYIGDAQEHHTPVDNLLSIGSYVLEYSDTRTAVYKRNDIFKNFLTEKHEDSSVGRRYAIEGVHLGYFDTSSDLNATFKAFLQDKIDSASIPQDYINDYKNDPRTTKTQGDSTFKLNVNSCTQTEWNEIFKDSSDGTYKCKPLMSNDNFVNALSFAINRQVFAENRGSIPSQSYFAPAYLWDPEEGKSYDETDVHKAVIAPYSPDTCGYSEAVATQLFDLAIQEEISKGNYKGYKDSETIRIEWMNVTDEKEYGQEIVKYFNDAFMKTNAYANGFRLNFDQKDSGNSDYQVVYNIMKSGKYDIGFGAISGMTNDPLGFLEVLKSNNSTGFTLNYGMNTAKIDPNDPQSYIIYQGKKWSFDGLWTAAKKGAVISADGSVNEEPISVISASSKAIADSVTIDGTLVSTYRLAIDIINNVVNSAADFKLFESQEEINNTTITVTATYTDSKNATQVATFNIPLGSALVQLEDVTNDGRINGESARIKLHIPQVLTSALTDGSVTEDVAFSQITALTATITYYMYINNVPVTNALDVVLPIARG